MDKRDKKVIQSIPSGDKGLRIRIITSIYIILTPIVSFLGGVLSFGLVLQLVWDESIWNDMSFALFWGSALYSIMVPVYFVVVYVIAHRFRHNLLLLFLAGCLLVSLLPGLMIFAPFGKVSVLVTVPFLTAGAIVAVCSWLFMNYRRMMDKTGE